MKISNWEKLSKTSLPSFMAIFYYCGGSKPSAIFLCHFGVERIAQTLKKVRELEKLEALEHMHRRKMLFIPNESERLGDQIGSLKTQIANYTGLDAAAYGKTKEDINKTVGFGQSSYSLSFKANVPPGDLSDVSLGLKEIEVEDVAIGSLRFGIELLDHHFSSGMIRIKPQSAGVCKLLASSRRANSKSSINAEIFMSNLPSLLNQNCKSLIICNGIRLEVTSTSGQLTAAIPDDVSRDFYDMLAEASFLRMMQERDAKISILLADGTELPLHFNPRPPTNSYFYETYLRLTILEKALRSANYRASFEMHVRDVFDQESSLRWLQCISRKSTIRFETADLPTSLLVRRRKAFFACAVWIKLGDKFLVFLCLWKAFAKREGGEVVFDLLTCDVFECFWTKKLDEEVESRWERFRSFCQEEASKSPLMMFGPPVDLDPSRSSATLNMESS